MFKSYLKVALRYLGRYRSYTFITISGLAVGITCCILIMLFIKSELGFDKFHSKADRIYRVWLKEIYEDKTYTNTVTPVPLGPALQSNLPEIESMVRVYGFNTLVKYGNNSFDDPVNMVDNSFFKVFDFGLKEGDRTNPFPNSNSIIISEKVAKKYFGNNSPLGKSLELQLGEDKILFTVSGIASRVPLESSIQYDLLIPFANDHYIWNENIRKSSWSNVFLETYILLKDHTNATEVEQKLPSVMKPIIGSDYKPGSYNLHLQPITDIHLNKSLPAGNLPISDPAYSYILSTIGFLVLLIACINFITLSVGRSTSRALEVGIRKVMGADRSQLIRQFWGEALLLTIISLLIGIGLAYILLKPFNQLAHRELKLAIDTFTIIFCILLVVIIGLMAGIYPAFVLSAFAPIQVLKGRLKTKTNIGFFRRALIVIQFVASVIMIIGTFVIGRQLNYLRSKDLGYNKEHIVIIPTNKDRKEGLPLAQRFRNEISGNPQVLGSTTSIFSMAEPGWVSLGYNDDKGVYRDFRMNAIDVDFAKTMDLKFIAGRNFSKDDPSDELNSMIVNEALVKEYGWKDPIGQHLPGKYEQRIIGVVKDFHFESLHTPIKPLVLVLKPDSMLRHSNDVSFNFSPQPRISVRLKGGSLQDQITFLRSAWKKVAGDQDFEYRFLDDVLNSSYEQEQRLGKIVQYASVLSIFIACLGLFGLATLVVIRRTKEIGIRKVLGANINNIVVLLSKEFVLLVVIASLLAFPIAWWALYQWLQDFAYRIAIPWWSFIGALFLALFIALLTVSVQAIRAALTNPVKSLRTE